MNGSAFSIAKKTFVFLMIVSAHSHRRAAFQAASSYQEKCHSPRTNNSEAKEILE